MKEAEDCQKLRGAVNQALIRRCPNGKTRLGEPKSLTSEFIGCKSERRELKHLSSARKRKQRDSRSSGERTGKSLNRYYVSLQSVVISELWDVRVIYCSI